MVKEHILYDFNSVKFVEGYLMAHHLVYLSECSCVCVCVCVCELCILLLESECFIYTYELGTVIVRLSISFQVEYCSLQL